MANKNADSSQPPVVQTQQQPPPSQQQQQQHNEACGQPPLQSLSGPLETRSRGGNPIIKSGHLFLSSKGIGWTSWKKRWFVLTRTSLVFSRSDPNAVSQKGSEVNLTLGGIDLNSSGSVVVKVDKRLLTVLFPDGRDGRAFTLKAETMDDLYEWKAALENALAQAPSASLVMGQNGILRNDNSTAANNSAENNDKIPVRSTVIGTPILLALENVDGTPSFLEKALRFVENNGVKVEGILRQAADVDDVERRIRDYEQGKNDFLAAEDAHVIADCVKYVLRELPSSPVPASCCNALIEACRTDRGGRVNAMRVAICETFPEPNRRLLQRILMMMQTVASHKTENRMSISAVAACMAPLLLRPLLSGDCEIENDFDVGGDGSLQLLQAAAAANHAQAIVITLLEEYDNIFGEGTLSQDLYSDSDESGSETEEATDDDDYEYEDEDEDDDGTNDSEEYTDGDVENMSDGTCSESSASGYNDSVDHDPNDDKVSDDLMVDSEFQEKSSVLKDGKNFSSSSRRASLVRRDDVEKIETVSSRSSDNSKMQAPESFSAEMSAENNLVSSGPVSSIQKSSTLTNRPGFSRRQWGRTPGKKNLSMESIDFPIDEEDVEIQTLEGTKLELQTKIAEEVKSNGVLQAALERRKAALHERRQALEKEVARLQEQLQKERDKRSALEAGLNTSQGPIYIPEGLDEKVKKDLQAIAKAESDITNLEQKVNNLEGKLNQQHTASTSSNLEGKLNQQHAASTSSNLEGKLNQQHAASTNSMQDSSNETQQVSDRQAKLKDKQKDLEAAATPILERSALKETHWDEKESGTEQQLLSTSLTSKQHSRQSQLQQSASRDSPKSVAAFTNSPRRSGAKNEGTNSTASALSKLTMRLNFLKERRSQIANELQNMDKGGTFDQPGPVSDKSRASENRQSSQNLEKGTRQSSQNLEKGTNGSSSNSENHKKPSSNSSSGSRSDMDPDGGKRSGTQNNTHSRSDMDPDGGKRSGTQKNTNNLHR